MGLRENVFFTTVAPIMGSILVIVMYISPLKAVLEVRRKAFLGALNPLPIAVSILNCAAWVLYASHQRDVYIFWPNALALFLGIWMTLSLFPYASGKVQELISVSLAAGTVIFSVEGFAVSLARADNRSGQLVWGITSNAILIMFYTAPLSVMAKVVRERNSVYFYWPLSLLACLNGLLWFAYGMAIEDWMVYAINGAGAVLAGSQLLLIFIFPRGQEPAPKTVSVAHDSPPSLMVNKADVEVNVDANKDGPVGTHVTATV